MARVFLRANSNSGRGYSIGSSTRRACHTRNRWNHCSKIARGFGSRFPALSSRGARGTGGPVLRVTTHTSSLLALHVNVMCMEQERLRLCKKSTPIVQTRRGKAGAREGRRWLRHCEEAGHKGERHAVATYARCCVGGRYRNYESMARRRLEQKHAKNNVVGVDRPNGVALFIRVTTVAGSCLGRGG